MCGERDHALLLVITETLTSASRPLRFEPDILLRAKQEFLKIDSATDLE